MTNLVLAWTLLGLTAPVQEPVTLKLTPVENMENKYTLKVNLNYDKSDLVFTADLSNRVVQIMEDGSFIVASTQRNAQLVVTGVPVKGDPNKAPTFTTYAKDGRTATISGDDIGPDDYRFSNLTALVWPGHAVKNEETWTVETKGNADTGAIETKSVYRLLSQEELLGRKCNKVGFEIAETAGSKPASAKGVAWVDRTTGFTVKMAVELKNAPLAGQIVDAVVELTLVPLA